MVVVCARERMCAIEEPLLLFLKGYFEGMKHAAQVARRCCRRVFYGEVSNPGS